jgi:hypothetical protein
MGQGRRLAAPAERPQHFVDILERLVQRGRQAPREPRPDEVEREALERVEKERCGRSRRARAGDASAMRGSVITGARAPGVARRTCARDLGERRRLQRHDRGAWGNREGQNRNR